jgi:hypothetical protein
MPSRFVGLRCGCLLFAALLLGRGAQAQCANNADTLPQTCFGTNSLASATSGSSNAAFGEGAMQLTTTGRDDTAVGQQALQSNTTGTADTAIGSGALTFNTTGGWNTAAGSGALLSNTTGAENTAVGSGAMLLGTTPSGNTAVGRSALEYSNASYNTALGYSALGNDTTGGYNVGSGAYSLYNSATGTLNTASGAFSLYVITSGSYNTAFGGSALQELATGHSNLALGIDAGISYNGAESNNIVLANNGVTGESNVTRIGANGVQTKAFVAGIFGATSSSGVAVFVNSAGQLGTVTSSLRFKEDVADLGAAGADLMKLRPVTFRYKPQYDDGQRILQYGLIAEEVAAVNPGLVQFGEDGKPLTVRYHFVNAMLLDEVQKQHATIAAQAARLDEQAAEITGQKAQIEDLTERLLKLEAQAAVADGGRPSPSAASRPGPAAPPARPAA